MCVGHCEDDYMDVEGTRAGVRGRTTQETKSRATQEQSPIGRR